MNRKVLIIGLDGATFDVINPLIEEGLMPNLAKLIERGASGSLLSTIPPISGPAWLSLATGMKPEKTSVYDFCNRKDNSYRLQGITSADYAGRAIWDYLSKANKQVGILNYPICIHPYTVNGFMTAGFLASPNGEFTFPADLKQELNELVGGEYELSVPYHNARYDDTELFLNDIKRVLSKKLRTTAYLLREKQWDFFWVVISETDWLQHIMWRHLDENHPLYQGQKSIKLQQSFKEFWKLIDKSIGQFVEIVGNDTNIIIHSDHGFGSNEGIFKLNAWLEREGYLVRGQWLGRALHHVRKVVCSSGTAIARGVKLDKFFSKLYDSGKKVKKELMFGVLEQIDLKKSTAFDPGHTIPFGGIYVNDYLVDTPEEKRKLAGEIAKKLNDWGVKNNVKVEIWQDHDFDKQLSYKGPDLLVGIDNWKCVMLKDRFDGELYERRPHSTRHTGSHRMNGIFVAAGPDIQKGIVDHVHICDIAPTLLYLFDEPIPSEIDGQVIKDIFTTEYLNNNSVRFQTNSPDYKCPVDSSAVKKLTTEEQDNIQRQLKDLGYM